MPNAGPTISHSLIGRLQIYTESSFANDETSSLGSFTDVPFQEGSASITLTQETHDPMHAVQNQLDYREEILGKKSCQVSFTVPLAPTGTSATQGVAAVQSALGLLLKTVMGGESLGSGTAANGNFSSASAGTAATASKIVKAGAMGWVNTSSELEARPVKNSSGTTLATKVAYSATPQSSDALIASASYFFTQDPATSLNVVVRGLESNDEWVLLGCQLESMSLSLPLDGTIPTAQFTLKGASWLQGDDAAGTFADIASVTYTNTSPITGQAGRFIYGTVGTTTYTGTTVNVSAVAFEPQIAYQSITSPSGTNGILRWRMSRSQGPAVQGSFTTYHEGDTYWDDKASKADKIILYQIGTTAGNTVLLEVATAQITDVQISNDNGISGVTATFKGRLDADITSPTTDIHYSPFRIHFL